MDPTARRLAALFVVGILLLFSPLTETFSRQAVLFGLPLFPVYLFVAWGVIVAAAWYFVRGGRP